MQAVLRVNESDPLQPSRSAPRPPTADDDPVAAARALKEQGNETFQARDYAGALAHWAAALEAFPLLPPLLSGLAAAQAKLEQHPSVILCVTAALLWTPADGKALQRRAAAAAAEGWSEACELAAVALRDAPADPSAAALLGSLQAQAAADAISAQMPGSPRKYGGGAQEVVAARHGSMTAQDAMRAEAAQLDVDTYVHESAESRRALKEFGKTNPNMLRYVRMWLGPEPVQLDEAFVQDEAIPEGCVEGSCMQHLALTAASTFRNWMGAAEAIILVLARGGSEALANVSSELPLEDPLGGEDNPDVDSLKLMQRLRRTDRVRWWESARIGAVDFSARLPFHAGEKEHIANYGNTPQYALPMHAGGVHVAVGFVDLGELAETLLARDSDLGGLRWVGYEASAHAVAKTRVVLCMLRQGAPEDSVVQVRRSVARCGVRRPQLC